VVNADDLKRFVSYFWNEENSEVVEKDEAMRCLRAFLQVRQRLAARCEARARFILFWRAGPTGQRGNGHEEGFFPLPPALAHLLMVLAGKSAGQRGNALIRLITARACSYFHPRMKTDARSARIRFVLPLQRATLVSRG
jgi:hypothetical protein